MRLVYRIKQFIVAFGDLVCFMIGVFLALTLRHFRLPLWSEIHDHLGLFVATFFLWIIVNFINGLYDLSRQRIDKKMYRTLLEAAVISFITGVAFFYLFPNTDFSPKTILLMTVIFGYGLSTCWRILYHRSIRLKTPRTNILFVGASPETLELIDILARYPDKGYHVTALIDPMNSVKPQQFPDITVYHSLRTLRPSITTHAVNFVVIAPELRRDPDAIRELYGLLFWQVQMTDLTEFYEVVTGRIPPSTFSEAWFLEHLRSFERPIYDHVRTFIDYVAAIVLCVICILLFPWIALAIKLSSKGPLFIKQKRMGRFGQTFTLYKFRSMFALSADGSAELSGVQFATKNDQRITSVGKWLRKMRLDELPQIWNLLRRDVTLIGPRPERPEIVKALEEKMPYYPLRHVVRPGLTGWALIHQNYTDNYDTSLEKLQYDLYYIKNQSFLLDLAILLKTVNVIIKLMGQ